MFKELFTEAEKVRYDETVKEAEKLGFKSDGKFNTTYTTLTKGKFTLTISKVRANLNFKSATLSYAPSTSTRLIEKCKTIEDFITKLKFAEEKFLKIKNVEH